MLVSFKQLRMLNACRMAKVSCAVSFIFSLFLLDDQGLRSLDDLREKGNLTSQQKIGLNHYHDFLDRMPREEAGEIEQVVRIIFTLSMLILPFFCPENVVCF